MATTKYLGETGLVYLWSKIKSWVSNYVKITTVNTDSTITVGNTSVLIPNKTSQITNDSGYITAADVPEGAAASTTTPLMDGTASVGTETAFARGDHRHPTDTTKIDKVSNSEGYVAVFDSTGGLEKSELSYNEMNIIIGGKADKVTGATSGNLAALNANGNLIDSGVSAANAGTDTKNTAGAENFGSKLFLIGAREQTANPRTYSQSNAYITEGKVYSNAVETVNLSDSQTLTNKTLTSPALTGTPTAPTASAGTNTTQVATTAYVTTAIQNAQVGASTFQGTASGTFAPTNYKKGYYWVVGTAGTYVGQTCEAGDMIFCVSDYSSAYSASDFSVVQNNLDIAEMTTSEMDTATNNWS